MVDWRFDRVLPNRLNVLEVAIGCMEDYQRTRKLLQRFQNELAAAVQAVEARNRIFDYLHIIYQDADKAFAAFTATAASKGGPVATYLFTSKPKSYGALRGRQILFFKTPLRQQALAALEDVANTAREWSQWHDKAGGGGVSREDHKKRIVRLSTQIRDIAYSYGSLEQFDLSRPYIEESVLEAAKEFTDDVLKDHLSGPRRMLVKQLRAT